MKFSSKAFISFVILSVIYASVSIIASPPKASLQRYHVSSTTLRLLDSTIIFPVIVIWFIALYGYQKLQTYSDRIRDNKDGRQVLQLTRGVSLLAFWLPVTSTLSAIFGVYARNHPNLLAPTTIVSNYLSLLLPLVAFVFISLGSRKLSEFAHRRPSQLSIHLLAAVLIVAAVAYGYLVSSAHTSIYTVYHMSVPLVLATLVVPYIFTWYLGLLAVDDLLVYSRHIKGILYRKSWWAVAVGIGWITLLSIMLQYLTSVSAKLNNLSLGWILALIYTILPVLAIGYVFIAIGAKRLMKIEEV